MQVFGLKYVPYGNEVETYTVLANSIDEAKRYLCILTENESGIKNLTIIHSYLIATPTSYSIRSKDDNGFPTCLNWKDKNSNKDGVVLLWTELPESIKKKLAKAAR